MTTDDSAGHISSQTILENILRDPRGLPASGLSRNDDHSVIHNRADEGLREKRASKKGDLCHQRIDRQLLGILGYQTSEAIDRGVSGVQRSTWYNENWEKRNGEMENQTDRSLSKNRQFFSGVLYTERATKWAGWAGSFTT